MSSSPYKDKNELISAINSFMNRHKSFFDTHSKRVSDYFEMTSYNDVVEFYKRDGYEIKPQNLGAGDIFRYKLSPTGHPKNFSYFAIAKPYEKRAVTHEYEIHHNISVESANENHIYYTPDISVVEKDCVIETKSGAYRADFS